MKSKDIGALIEDELGYKIEVIIEKERNNIKFLIRELQQTVNVPIHEIVPVLMNDQELKELLLKKIKSRIFN